MFHETKGFMSVFVKEIKPKKNQKINVRNNVITVPSTRLKTSLGFANDSNSIQKPQTTPNHLLHTGLNYY